MSYRLSISEEAKADYMALDNSQRLQVNKSFQKLQRQGGQAGEALHGSLSGYRKLKHKRLGLRVIFREALDDSEVVEIIAIGKRGDEAVYRLAEKRLRR